MSWCFREDPRECAFHRIISEHIDEYFQATGAPPFIVNRFTRFLGCGLPELGSIAFQCGQCGGQHFVPLSCKQRGLCPWCTEWMREQSVRSMMMILPTAPFRQWVVNYPLDVTKKLAFNSELLLGVEKIVISSLRDWVEDKLGGTCGGVLVRHRAGATLNLMIHSHFLLLDGVFKRRESDGMMEFLQAPAPELADLQGLAEILRKRIGRFLKKNDISTTWDQEPAVEADQPILGQNVRTAGLHLFVGARIGAEKRTELRNACDYLLRGFLDPKRLSLRGESIVYRLRSKKEGGGVRELLFTPMEFIKAIASALPRNGIPIMRYFGILGSGMKDRKHVIPKVTPPVAIPSLTPSETDQDLVALTFESGAPICPHCRKSVMKKVAVLRSAREYKAFLLSPAAARAPPGASQAA